jgi:hypothetical protein
MCEQPPMLVVIKMVIQKEALLNAHQTKYHIVPFTIV